MQYNYLGNACPLPCIASCFCLTSLVDVLQSSQALRWQQLGWTPLELLSAMQCAVASVSLAAVWCTAFCLGPCRSCRFILCLLPYMISHPSHHLPAVLHNLLLACCLSPWCALDHQGDLTVHSKTHDAPLYAVQAKSICTCVTQLTLCTSSVKATMYA